MNVALGIESSDLEMTLFIFKPPEKIFKTQTLKLKINYNNTNRISVFGVFN